MSNSAVAGLLSEHRLPEDDLKKKTYALGVAWAAVISGAFVTVLAVLFGVFCDIYAATIDGLSQS